MYMSLSLSLSLFRSSFLSVTVRVLHSEGERSITQSEHKLCTSHEKHSTINFRNKKKIKKKKESVKRSRIMAIMRSFEYP